MLTSLAIIFIFGIMFGKLFEKIGLPKLIGMILLGAIIGENSLNLISSDLNLISAQLRKVALIVVLTRAGLSLNVKDLKAIGKPAILISFVPAIFEILGIVLVSSLLFNISLVEALLLGSVIAAVSPAVIVPRMINILSLGYKKAPAQTILAGASVDDIFVIVLFSTFLSFLQGGDISIKSILFIPTSIVFGALLGIISGILIYKVYNNFKSSKVFNINQIEVQTILVLSISFLLVLVEDLTQDIFPISGLIAIMTMGMYFLNKDVSFAKDLGGAYNKVWSIMEILLFVLVGAIIDINYVLEFGILAIITILVALVFRMIGVFVALAPSNFSKKEKLFCAISYLPKATVQASIGTIPLTLGLPCGNLVFTMAIIAILITAPLGALLIDKNYDKLLEKN